MIQILYDAEAEMKNLYATRILSTLKWGLKNADLL